MSTSGKFISRKFLLAAFASVVSTVALFTIGFTGVEWVSAQSLILGLYGTANVASKRTTDK